jgi:serine O-acetyltransferase
MLELLRKDLEIWHNYSADMESEPYTLKKGFTLFWRHLPLRAMFWYRLGSYLQKLGIPLIPGFTQRLLYRFFGLEIVVGANYGGGLYIPHPIGTVVAAHEIGENCSIISNVTIGMRNNGKFPTIGNNVFIGAGARILGDIHIGDNAVIGANAVVINDIPNYAVAVGVPARVVRINTPQ